MGKELRNLQNIDMNLDVSRKDGRGILQIRAYQTINLDEADPVSLEKSMKNGIIRKYLDAKVFAIGETIKGEAKEVEKVDGVKAEEKVKAKKDIEGKSKKEANTKVKANVEIEKIEEKNNKNNE